MTLSPGCRADHHRTVAGDANSSRSGDLSTQRQPRRAPKSVPQGRIERPPPFIEVSSRTIPLGVIYVL
jgi:hypothetical protein